MDHGWAALCSVKNEYDSSEYEALLNRSWRRFNSFSLSQRERVAGGRVGENLNVAERAGVDFS
jgi:hypothetical protein